LNRYPELKSFLKDGEAESYAGIKVTYVAGRTAVLTIYQDQQKQEEVVLHELKNKAAMHELFRQKGFVLKSELVSKQVTGPSVGVAKADATTTAAAAVAAKASEAAAGQQANQTAQQQQEAAEAEAAAIQVLRLGAAAALRRQDNADAAATGGGGRGRRKKNNNNARNKKSASSKASSQQGGVVVDGGGAGSSSWSEMLQLYAFLTAAVLLAAGSYKGLRGRHRAQGIGGSSSRLWRRAR
jgi:Sep15/SelM redox domain